MEAPGEDELEWMALQEQQRDLELLDAGDVDFVDLATSWRGFRDDAEQGGFLTDEDDAMKELPGDVVDEPVELLDELDPPVKRKKLVLPDISVVAQKLQKLEERPGPRRVLKEIGVEVNSHIVDQSRGTEEVEVVHEAYQSREKEEAEANFPHRRAADISGEFIPITAPSGERVYAELNKIVAIDDLSPGRNDGRLLSDSVEKMIKQLELEQFEQACALADNKQSNAFPSMDKPDQLWVDKYAPNSFTELLSDEQINREVLGWLKQWDLCVYGANRYSTPKEVFMALRQQKYGTQHASDAKTNRKHIGNLEDGSKKSSDGRPDQKVLLLCGSPGLGKTTLAHVAAKHCGYRIVEINASDDRSSSCLQTKILDAIQMKPVTGDSKPNCLIIDEIDGAMNGAEGKSAISFLVDLATSEGRVKGIDGDKKVQKKKASIPRLSRPVICICNDMYAPVIRPLRQVARIHVFAPPSPHRIVTRLKFICKMEGYDVNARALTALAVHTESDIRSCLNTLQFLHQKGHRLNTMDVGSQVIGKKDMTSSMFDIWFETFWKRKPRRGAADLNRGLTEFHRLHDLLTNHAEYELGIEGIFENFLHVRYHDAYLQKTIQCLNLLTESDIFGRRTVARQQFFLNNYRPSIQLAIRRLIAQPVRPTLEWPKSFQRNKQILAANLEILTSWLTLISPAISRSILRGCLVHDILSPLLSIMAPNLRPVASNLLSQQEREDVKQLVDTMISYGLRYKKPKVDCVEQKMGSEAGSLDPPIYSFIRFKEYVPKHPELSVAVQQMLSHEVDIEAIRRESAARNAVRKDQPLPSAPERTHRTSVTHITSYKRTTQQATTAVTTKTTVVKTVVKQANFFDRFRTSSSKRDQSDSEATTAKRDARPLLFKFHEGFTNAVKKPVLMRDFLS